MIKKANGEVEEFDERRLFNSLVRAGAEEEIANRVITKVMPKIYDGMTTKKIYSMAFKTLRRIDNPTASRYEIKWAIMRLGKGKQGFSFEQYIAKLFEKMGYKTKLNYVAKGRFIDHEIDLVLEKDGERIMVECKHKSKPGILVHIQVPLYVYARFLDLKHKFNQAYVVTNARFTRQATKYSKGVRVKLIGWNEPQGNDLRTLVDLHKVYPVTVLKSVDDNVLQKLLDKQIVIVTEILEYTKLSSLIGRQKAAEVVAEAEKLLKA